MTAVFVHGMAETAAVWDGVRHHLPHTSTVAVSLPGFGTPLPDGFDVSYRGYTSWLCDQLAPIVTEHGRVDLVGHNWGSSLVCRVASQRPDLVRSFVSDDFSFADPDYRDNELTIIWRTPGIGEEFLTSSLALPDHDLAQFFAEHGVPYGDALALARSLDHAMADCMLKWARSDEQRTAAAQAFGLVQRPGMLVSVHDDPFASIDLGRRVAERIGAQVLDLVGSGHWWMLQRPAEVTVALERFWTGLTG